MANTLTGLIPTLYESLDTVSRELVGFIPAVSRNSSAERAAKDQTITVPIVPALTAADVTPGLYAPDTGDITVSNVTMSITKSRAVPIRINGEETRGLNSAGTNQTIMRDRFTQAMRTLTNEIETDLAALHIYASNAYGTYNSTPFGTAADLSDFAQMNKLLDDNGAPRTMRKIVLSSSAMANLRGKQSVLFKMNEAGTDQLLRQGIIGRVQGFDIHDSAQVKTAVTAGTGASATTDNAGYDVGDTVITLASAGTGTIIAGDIITFASDTTKYLVVSGDADVSNGGTITLAAPGLKKAIAASATNITLVAATNRNMAFSQDAIQLITRVPALPEGGDMADDLVELTDPVSGLAFQIARYRQYKQVHYEVAIAWGVKVIKPEHLGLLIGT